MFCLTSLPFVPAQLPFFNSPRIPRELIAFRRFIGGATSKDGLDWRSISESRRSLLLPDLQRVTDLLMFLIKPIGVRGGGGRDARFTYPSYSRTRLLSVVIKSHVADYSGSRFNSDPVLF